MSERPRIILEPEDYFIDRGYIFLNGTEKIRFLELAPPKDIKEKVKQNLETMMDHMLPIDEELWQWATRPDDDRKE